MIIPIALADFRKLLKNAKEALQKPKSEDLKALLKSLGELATTVNNESEWYQKIQSQVAVAFQKR